MPLLGPLATAVAGVFLATSAAALGAPGTPGGMVSTDFRIAGGPSGGLDDVTWSTTVLAEPTRTTDHYFWADQFDFTGNHVGYIGLQPRPDAGGAPQGAAYFSVFGAGPTTTDPNCSQGADGGAGLSCHVSFAYQVGHTYRLNVTRSAADTWTGSVADAAGGSATHIATWTVPAGWGALSPASSAFTEYYAKLPGGCDDLPYALVLNGPPVAEHGTVPGAVTGAKTYGGTGGGYVNCGTAQYANVWRDAAGSHSETGLPHKPGAAAPTPSSSASGTRPATPGAATPKGAATPGRATKTPATPGASSASAATPSADAAGTSPGPEASGSGPSSALAPAPAPAAASADGGGSVLPALALGTFAAVMVGVYFWWSKKLGQSRTAGRRRQG